MRREVFYHLNNTTEFNTYMRGIRTDHLKGNGKEKMMHSAKSFSSYTRTFLRHPEESKMILFLFFPFDHHFLLQKQRLVMISSHQRHSGGLEENMWLKYGIPFDVREDRVSSTSFLSFSLSLSLVDKKSIDWLPIRGVTLLTFLSLMLCSSLEWVSWGSFFLIFSQDFILFSGHLLLLHLTLSFVRMKFFFVMTLYSYDSHGISLKDLHTAFNLEFVSAEHKFFQKKIGQTTWKLFILLYVKCCSLSETLFTPGILSSFFCLQTTWRVYGCLWPRNFDTKFCLRFNRSERNESWLPMFEGNCFPFCDHYLYSLLFHKRHPIHLLHDSPSYLSLAIHCRPTDVISVCSRLFTLINSLSKDSGKEKRIQEKTLKMKAMFILSRNPSSTTFSSLLPVYP